MPVPILSYLRVYEPLRVFQGAAGDAVREAYERGPVDATAAGALERELALRAVLRERVLPEGRVEVLATTWPDGVARVCPLDLRPRAGAALIAFLDSVTPLLAASALPIPVRTARRLAEAAIAEIGDGAAHVVSAGWTVPLPWFVLVEQDQRQVQREPRRVWWTVSMTDARERVDLAETVIRETLGESPTGDGPAEVLAETGNWLDRFADDAVVELDYGGIATVLTDEELAADRSAEHAAAALEALVDGEAEAAAEAYAALQDFWTEVAARERAS
ncbi:hypothetical protein [Pseudonocardia thermophila]|uniref:hypothetical protein n=1 Tax=Pseudonocardia thermophila TaxID=1848 RepID=UPI0009378A1C|nr:hypothetical protein [Pseudonocardia thermophila]